MKTSTTRNNIRSVGCNVAGFCFWIGIWWILAAIVDKKVLLPSPIDVWTAGVQLVQTVAYWLSILASIVRVLLGYAFGCAIGVVLAAICYRFRIADILLSPVLATVRAVPVASFIILALVWIGKHTVPSFISFLMVLPVIAGNVRAGLDSTDPALYEVAKLYNFPSRKKIRHIYLPAALPYFTSGAHTSLGLAWKAGIAAEVLCSLTSSIGGNIYSAKLYLETPSLFAWTTTVIIISMAIEKLLFWRGRKKKTEEKV